MGSNTRREFLPRLRRQLFPIGKEAVAVVFMVILSLLIGAASGQDAVISSHWAPFLACQHVFDRIGQACLSGSVDCVPPMSGAPSDMNMDILHCDPVRLVCVPGDPTTYESALDTCLSSAASSVNPLASAFGPSAPFPKLPSPATTTVSPNDNWSAAKYTTCESQSGTCDPLDCPGNSGNSTLCSCSGSSCVTWESSAGPGPSLPVGIRVRSSTAPSEGSVLCPSAPFGGPTSTGCPISANDPPGFCGWRRPVDGVCSPDPRWKAGACMSHIGDGGLCASLGGVDAARAFPGDSGAFGWCYFPFIHGLEDCLKSVCNGDLRLTDGSTVMCNRYCRAAGIHSKSACLHGLNQAGAKWDEVTRSCHVHEHHCSAEVHKVNTENSADIGGKGRPQTNNYVWRMGRKWVHGHMDSVETCAAVRYPEEATVPTPTTINPAQGGTCSTLCADSDGESPRLCKDASDCEVNGGWCQHALGMPGTCIRYATESFCSQLIPWAIPYQVAGASLCVVTPKMNASDCAGLNDVQWLRGQGAESPDLWSIYPAVGPGVVYQNLCTDVLKGTWNPGVWTDPTEIEDTGDGPFAKRRLPLEWCSRRQMDLPMRPTQLGLLPPPPVSSTLPLDWLAMARAWQDMLVTVHSLQESSKRHGDRLIVWPADHTVVVRSSGYEWAPGLPTTAKGSATYAAGHPAYGAAWIELKGTRTDPARSKEHVVISVKATHLRTDLDLDLILGEGGVSIPDDGRKAADADAEAVTAGEGDTSVIFNTENGSLLPISEEVTIEMDPLLRQQLPTDMRVCVKITASVLGTAGLGSTSEIFWADPARGYSLMPRGRGGVDKDNYYNSVPGHVCRNMRAPPIAYVTPTVPALRVLLVVRNGGGVGQQQQQQQDSDGTRGGQPHADVTESRMKELEHDLAITRIKLNQALHGGGGSGGNSEVVDRVTDCNGAGRWDVSRGSCVCDNPFTMADTNCAATFCGMATGSPKGVKLGRYPCTCVAGWTGPDCDECSPTLTPTETIFLCLPIDLGRFVRTAVHILDINEWLRGARRLNVTLLERPRVPGSQGLDCACQGNPLYDGSPATVSERMVEVRRVLATADTRIVRDLSRGIPPWKLLRRQGGVGGGGGGGGGSRTPGIDEPILNATALNLTAIFLQGLGEAQLTVDFAVQALGAERVATAHQYFMDRSERTLILIVCFGVLAIAVIYAVSKCASEARAKVRDSRRRRLPSAPSKPYQGDGDLPWDGRQVFSSRSLMNRASRPPSYMSL